MYLIGFLNANTDRNARSPANYGLMDIIAALHWLQENIGAFGGDAQSVSDDPFYIVQIFPVGWMVQYCGKYYTHFPIGTMWNWYKNIKNDWHIYMQVLLNNILSVFETNDLTGNELQT